MVESNAWQASPKSALTPWHKIELHSILRQGDVQIFIIKFCGEQMHSNTTKRVQHRIVIQDSGNGDLLKPTVHP